MKITRRRLRKLIKEAIEVHQVPVDLDTVDSEEAYGIGYMKGADQDPDSDDDGFLSVAELIDMTHDISDDVDSVTDSDYKESSSSLSGRFADESSAKLSALSSASSFADSMGQTGTHVDDKTLSRIYTALLRMARLTQDRTLSGDEK